MGLFAWLLFGLIAGVLAKWLMPGKDPGGFVITVLLGIAGAFVGGFIGAFLGFGGVSDFSIGSLLTAIGGAMLLLFVYRQFR